MLIKYKILIKINNEYISILNCIYIVQCDAEALVYLYFTLYKILQFVKYGYTYWWKKMQITLGVFVKVLFLPAPPPSPKSANNAQNQWMDSFPLVVVSLSCCIIGWHWITLLLNAYWDLIVILNPQGTENIPFIQVI